MALRSTPFDALVPPSDSVSTTSTAAVRNALPTGFPARMTDSFSATTGSRRSGSLMGDAGARAGGPPPGSGNAPRSAGAAPRPSRSRRPGRSTRRPSPGLPRRPESARRGRRGCSNRPRDPGLRGYHNPSATRDTRRSPAATARIGVPSGASMSMPVRTVSVPKRGWASRPKPVTTRPSAGHGSWPRSAPQADRGARAAGRRAWRARPRAARGRGGPGCARAPRAAGRRRSAPPPGARAWRDPPASRTAALRRRSACAATCARSVVHGAPELDELPARPRRRFLARRQAVGGRVVAREPVEVVARDARPGRLPRADARASPPRRPRAARRAPPPARRACRAAPRAPACWLTRSSTTRSRRPSRRVELRLDLDDAAIELLERAALLGEGRDRSPRAPRGARSRAAAPPRPAPGLVELAAHLAERLLLGLEALPAGRRRRRRGAPGPERQRGARRGRARAGADRGGRITAAPGSGAAGREGADQPERRPAAGERRQPGGREERQGIEPQHRAEPAPDPGRAGLGARGAAPRARGATPSVARHDAPGARAAPPGGAPGTPARRRMLASAAPARRAAAVGAGGRRRAPRAPRTARQGEAARGEARAGAARAARPSRRPPAPRSRPAAGRAPRRGPELLRRPASCAGVTSSRAGSGFDGQAVQPVPARAEQPPKLGQRHGGPDVSHLRDPGQGADARDDAVRRLRPRARIPQHGHQPELRAPRGLGQAEREIPGQRRARRRGRRARRAAPRPRRVAPPRRQPRSVAPRT